MPRQQHSHSNFVRSRVYACLGVTCHLYFWQNDWGLLPATLGKTGVERTPNKSTQNSLWRRKFSCHSCQDSTVQPFDRESTTLTNKLSWLPSLDKPFWENTQNSFTFPMIQWKWRSWSSKLGGAHYQCHNHRKIEMSSLKQCLGQKWRFQFSQKTCHYLHIKQSYKFSITTNIKSSITCVLTNSCL